MAVPPVLGPPAAGTPPKTSEPIGFFGARRRARVLTEEVGTLRVEVERLRAELSRLGALDVLELERRRAELTAATTQQEERLQAELDVQAQRLADAAEQAAAEEQQRLAALRAEAAEVGERTARAQAQVVVTEDLAVLQEAGVYDYRHPLSDAVAYQAELARIQDGIKAMVRKDGGAIRATTSWTVNGSVTQGRAMVRDISKLMLRAYNAEADNLARGLKPYKLDTAIERLEKVVSTIERLGKSMDITVSTAYHRLRVKELELTADYQEKVAEEKAREREEKERLREERKAQQELDRERERLAKEQQHYTNALAVLLAKGDEDGAARLQAQIDDLAKAIKDVDYRAANVRAGYVYVISNIGAFGERMVKVGMTRRLEPLDRIRELSDASVPFNFDVHALFFSQDAVGIEAQMHQRLADRRVNRVNQRREFFYATPAEAREHLTALSGDLLHFDELPEALEFRQSSHVLEDASR